MILLITGASHTGKTALAQKLLGKYQYPYLSIDHLKMGLIRSGNTELTPMDDACCTLEHVLEANAEILSLAQAHNASYILIENQYEINIDL